MTCSSCLSPTSSISSFRSACFTTLPTRTEDFAGSRLESDQVVYLSVGLHSNVSRIHILALRRLLKVLSLGSQKRDRYRRTLAVAGSAVFVGRGTAIDRSRIADLLANPHERPVSPKRAVRWFQEAGFDLIAATPSHDPEAYAFLRPFFARTNSPLAHFLIQLRWILWNADYYVIHARRR